MANKRGSVLLVILLIFLFAILGFLVYLLYQYLPGKPEQPLAVFKQPEPELETGNLSYEVKQFYVNMKFNHNSISYKIDISCNEEKKERMKEAFNELSSKVGIISFHEASDPDIEVSCSEEAETEEIKEDFFIAGEGGAREIVPTGRYNIIKNGLILLYDNNKGIECKWPNVELHELLHVFGFEHSQDENSLMFPYLESCSQKLDESIISDLKQLYSKENLADLYFEEVIAVKRGIYLDFNVTIKNSGVIDTKSVVLSVFDDNEKIEDFDLKDIPLGAGVSFYVTNLMLKSRNSEDIEIRIDNENLIKEIDEENNIAELSFS